MLVALVMVALISLLSNLFINRRFEKYVMEQQEKKTSYIVDNISLQYNELTRTWNHDTVYTIGMYALHDGYIIKVRDRESDVVWDAENHDMEQCRQLMEEISWRMDQAGNTGAFVSAEYPLQQGSRTIGTVAIKYYGPFFLTESDFSFLNALNVILLLIGVFSLLISFVIGWVLARRIAHPITKTVEIATQISVGNYALRFEGQTKTKELDHLTSAINNLSEALEKQKQLRKQLTADVAHELRTPIASLGSHLEIMIEGIWAPTPERLQSCYEETMRLGKMAADLARLEESESDNLVLEKTPVCLMELARTVCGNFAGELANKDLTLTIAGDESPLNLDKDKISGVIANLISNAVKYTPKGGHVKVSVRDTERESILIVEDNGTGIPEEEQPFIFERLYRADKSRNRDTGGTGASGGAGIGLAIAKSAVSAHGGTVTVQSRLNSGSRFIVTLPKE
jgi:signal transduction histidine kinase